jgi:hypothetical protein
MDPVTAESEQADADFATEHKRPTFADEPSTEGPDESVPTGHGGMDIDQDESGGERPGVRKPKDSS